MQWKTAPDNGSGNGLYVSGPPAGDRLVWQIYILSFRRYFNPFIHVMVFVCHRVMPFVGTQRHVVFAAVQIGAPPRERAVGQDVASGHGHQLHVAPALCSPVVRHADDLVVAQLILQVLSAPCLVVGEDEEHRVADHIPGLTYGVAVVFEGAYAAQSRRTYIVSSADVDGHRVALKQHGLQRHILLRVQRTELKLSENLVATAVKVLRRHPVAVVVAVATHLQSLRQKYVRLLIGHKFRLALGQEPSHDAGQHLVGDIVRDFHQVPRTGSFDAAPGEHLVYFVAVMVEVVAVVGFDKGVPIVLGINIHGLIRMFLPQCHCKCILEHLVPESAYDIDYLHLYMKVEHECYIFPKSICDALRFFFISNIVNTETNKMTQNERQIIIASSSNFLLNHSMIKDPHIK